MDLLYTTLAVMAALLPFTISVMIKMDILYAGIGLMITMGICYNILRNWFDQYRISDIRGKYVLVTGCDTGFGRKLAVRLAKAGVKVIAGCLKEETIQELEEDNPDTIIGVQMDVSKPDSVTNAYYMVVQRHPQVLEGIWGIVNNAGIMGDLVPSEWLTYEDYLNVFNINTFGMVSVTNTFLTLVKKTRGRVVNTSSYLSRLSPPNSAAYCMSKYAVRSYTDCLRREMLGFNVTVSSIEPGAFKTNLIVSSRLVQSGQRIFDNLKPSLRDEYGQAYLDDYNKGMAKAADFVCSSNTDLVVDAYEHALFATYPRSRYRVGMDSKMCSLISLFPDWFLDLPFRFVGEKPKGVALS